MAHFILSLIAILHSAIISEISIKKSKMPAPSKYNIAIIFCTDHGSITPIPISKNKIINNAKPLKIQKNSDINILLISISLFPNNSL